MNIGRIIIMLFLLTYATAGMCQTGLDTAAVISGTVKRDIPVSAPTPPKAPESFTPANIKKVSGAKPALLEKPLENKKDTAVLQAFQRSQIAYYLAIEKRNLNNKATNDSVNSYYLWALQNRKQIISRQQFTGTIIFALVVILVLSGLLFSAIQFYIALKSVKKRSASANISTSFKASLSGVEVSSSVLGVIVLVISIVFFYLYLSRVYPLVSLDQIPTELPETK